MVGTCNDLYLYYKIRKKHIKKSSLEEWHDFNKIIVKTAMYHIVDEKFQQNGLDLLCIVVNKSTVLKQK